MNAEIICVGTELLLGDILNTNAKYLSGRLAEMGVNVYSQSVVGDNMHRLEKQIKLSLARSEIVILSGGLGPTPDDITKEAVAKALNLPLEEDKESLKLIKDYFARTGREMPESNLKQALKPKGATVLKNDQGTAPGYAVREGNATVIMLPGPPSELTDMFEKRVVPLLKGASNSTFVSHNVHIFGIGESMAAEVLGDLLEGTNPTVATYASAGEVDIRITASAENTVAAERLINPVLDRVKELFGDNVYGIDCDSVQQRTVNLLREKGVKICTAESCTAGMLSSRITEIPGSSEIFEMGVTAYANYIKVQALAVDEDVIRKKGAVCDEVAAEMAVGIRTMCGAEIGLGITGVAGPGESEGKPAGLVYIALADSENVFVRKILCRGSNRDVTRIIASSTALDMARRYLEGSEEFMSYATPIGEPIKLMEGYTLPNAPAKELAVEKDAPTEAQKNMISDEEIARMFTTVDDEAIDDLPEKLELEGQSFDYVLEDEGYVATPKVAKGYGEYVAADFEILSDENTKDTKKKSFWGSFFPKKSDSAAEKTRKSIFLVALVVLLFTTGYLVNYFVEGLVQTEMIKEAAEVWKNEDSYKKNDKGVFIGFETLMEQNKDIKAWIKIDGTNIDNPVYQTDNNDYYIDHNMKKESSRYGALFIDMDGKIGRTKETTSQNIVVYGHHMKDGTMFGPLKSYTDINFYKKNPIIDFTTLYRQGKYKVFAVFITNSRASHDNGKVFNYRYPEFAEGTKYDFMKWIDDVKLRSIIDTGVDIVETDEILTLSTCTYEFDDARLVVMARRVRDGETNIKDTYSAKLNKSPLYPQIWYDTFGGKKPNVSTPARPDSSSAPQNNMGSFIPGHGDMFSSEPDLGFPSDTSSTDDTSANPGGTTNPDSGATKPDNDTTNPDSGTTNPDSGTTNPDSGTTNPDSGTTNPDSGTTKPDSGTTKPDSGTTNPDSGTTQTNSDTTQPDNVNI